MTRFFNIQYPCLIRVLPALGLCLSFMVASPIHAQDNTRLLGTLMFESVPANGSDNPPPANPQANPDTSDTQQALITSRGASSGASSAALTDQRPDQDEFEAAVRLTLEEQGMYSSLLAEQYEALGGLYHNNGEYQEAIQAYEEAMHIHKVNKGLFNLDQADLVRKQIRAYTSLGDFDAVDNHRHYLYYLHNKSLAQTDPRLMAEKLDWADWNIEAYVKGYRDSYTNPVNLINSVDPARGLRTVNFDIPAQPPDAEPSASGPATIPVSINVPQLNSNSVITNAAVTDYTLRSIPYALSNEIIVNQRLHDAEEIYEDVLEQIRLQGGSMQEQMAMQEKLANISYLLKREYEKFERVQDQGSIAYNRANQEFTSDAKMMTNRLYTRTRKAIEDITSQMAADTTFDAGSKATAFITLGDLHMSFNRPKRAFTAYQQAYELLLDSGVKSEDAVARLTPAPDTALPAYGIHPYTREFFAIQPSTEIPYKGYLDVSFNKDAYGQLSAVKILGESPGTPAVIRSALLDHLRSQQYRPLFDGNSGIDQNDIHLRYYYFHQ